MHNTCIYARNYEDALFVEGEEAIATIDKVLKPTREAPKCL